jgi:hypothetical protein
MSSNAFRYLIVIASPKLSKTSSEVFSELGVPLFCKSVAIGTASSEMMDIIGLGSSEKRLFMSVLPKDFAELVLKKFRKIFLPGSVYGGIAFTLPLSGMSKYISYIYENKNQQLPENEKRKGEIGMETKFSLVAVIANQGYSEEVMNAARGAGARGGTVIHSRMISDEAAEAISKLDVQDEKEIILIVASDENKLAIMKEVSARCGTHSDAKGVVLSLPIDSVAGIGEY